MRTIKRYSNRKLYDTTVKHYVTLKDLAVAIREGETVSIVAHDTGADLTSSTLAQVIFEEEKRSPSMSVELLHKVIREGLRGENWHV